VHRRHQNSFADGSPYALKLGVLLRLCPPIRPSKQAELPILPRQLPLEVRNRRFKRDDADVRVLRNEFGNLWPELDKLELRCQSVEVLTMLSIIKPLVGLSLTVFGQLGGDNVKTKGDVSVATVCDFALQSLIMDALGKVFPTDLVLGEEEVGKVSRDFLALVGRILPSGFDLVAACRRARGAGLSIRSTVCMASWRRAISRSRAPFW
jgi:hypothetical protein